MPLREGWDWIVARLETGKRAGAKAVQSNYKSEAAGTQGLFCILTPKTYAASCKKHILKEVILASLQVVISLSLAFLRYCSPPCPREAAEGHPGVMESVWSSGRSKWQGVWKQCIEADIPVAIGPIKLYVHETFCASVRNITK